LFIERIDTYFIHSGVLISFRYKFFFIDFSFLIRGASMVLKQIEENEKEKVYKEDAREQENAAMLESMQKLQEKDWEEFSKRKDIQKKLAVKYLL
jgi:hypothetical protein